MQIIREQDGTFTIKGLEAGRLSLLSSACDEASVSARRNADNLRDNPGGRAIWEGLAKDFKQMLKEFRFYITAKGQLTDAIEDRCPTYTKPEIRTFNANGSIHNRHLDGKYYCSTRETKDGDKEWKYLTRTGWLYSCQDGYFYSKSQIETLLEKYPLP